MQNFTGGPMEITVDCVCVRVGQVWRNWDTRQRDREPGSLFSIVRIEDLPDERRHAIVVPVVIADGKYAIRMKAALRKILCRRLRPTGNGYKHVGYLGAAVQTGAGEQS